MCGDAVAVMDVNFLKSNKKRVQRAMRLPRDSGTEDMVRYCSQSIGNPLKWKEMPKRLKGTCDIDCVLRHRVDWTRKAQPR